MTNEGAARTGCRTRLLSCWAGVVVAACAAAEPSEAQDVHPQPGERIRVELSSTSALPVDLPSPWEGTFVMFRDEALIGTSAFLPPLAMPLADIRSLEVERRRSRAHTVAKGALVGTAFGVGMWKFLGTLCRSGCDSDFGSAGLPATLTGGVVAVLVGVLAPGRHWVTAELPR